MEVRLLRRRIRILLGLFALGLVLSGLTAVPLVWEIDLLDDLMGEGTVFAGWWPDWSEWLGRVRAGLHDTQDEHPFLFYGTDWLAFAHVVIAIAFLGPIFDPVRNVWVIHFGMIACVLVIAMAMVFGPLRGIPPFWRWIDCSFGIVGIVPLRLSLNHVRRLALLEQVTAPRF